MTIMTDLPNVAEAQAHLRRDLAMQFEMLSDAQLPEVVRLAVNELGGTLIEPGVQPRHRKPFGQDYELELLGITYPGSTLTEAAREWAKAALRSWRETTQCLN